MLEHSAHTPAIIFVTLHTVFTIIIHIYVVSAVYTTMINTINSKIQPDTLKQTIHSFLISCRHAAPR